jgi:hypothetical protein
MVTQPRRQRRSRPAPHPAPATAYLGPAGEWRVRLALALLVVSAVSVIASLVALLALGGAIAHLGAPQGPLEFAVVFVGAFLGLGGDGLILSGSLAVLRPQSRLSRNPAAVTAGLVLQLPAAAAVGVLQSSWLFAAVYLLMVAGLALLWVRTSPPPQPRPAARHAVPEQVEGPPAEAPLLDRQPIPWIGSAPPPPSASSQRQAEQAGPECDGPFRPRSGRGPGL